MKNLLYIEGSPRQDSFSSSIAKKFLSIYQDSHPGNGIHRFDIWNRELPPFNGDTIDAKYAVLGNLSFTPAQKEKWQGIMDIFEEFSDNNHYLFSVPMWNFGIPYPLKHFIDLLTQPGMAFNFHPQTGYEGLLKNRKAVLIYTSGSTYVEEYTRNLDFQKPYLRTWLNFIGISDIQEITFAPTLNGSPEQINASKEEAELLAEKIARNL